MSFYVDFPEMKKHAQYNFFKREMRAGNLINITEKDINYSGELDCYVLKSNNEPLNGKYYFTDKEEIRYYKNGKLHRDKNLPAEIYKSGSARYYVNGKLHRLNGPAEIYTGSHYDWYINDYYIDYFIMVDWLNENNIPLDWYKWTENDKFRFVMQWSDYEEEE